MTRRVRSIRATTALTTATALASSSPTVTAVVGAPKVVLPPDMNVAFMGFTGADPQHQAVLRDASYAATTVLEAESRARTKETPNFKRYFTGAPGAEFVDQVIAYGRIGNVATGTYRYYRPTVTGSAGAGTVVVTYCEDQRKAGDKDARTGKVKVTAPSLNDFRAWTFEMMKSASGDWQVFDCRWKQGRSSARSHDTSRRSRTRLARCSCVDRL